MDRDTERWLKTWDTVKPPSLLEFERVIRRLKDAGKNFKTEKGEDDDLEQGTWHSDYSLNKTDRGIYLLNPIIREFILHYSRKQQHLLQGWRRKAISTVERIGVDTHKDVINAHIDASHEVNQLIETLESLDIDEIQTPLPVKKFISLFSGPQQAAVPLPNGLFLFEGRSSWFGCDVDEKTVGIGTEFHRKRATSTTWLPQIALPWAVIAELEPSDPLISILQRKVPQPFLLAHEIVSDGVLGVDVQAIEETAMEREVILRPFLHFHVVGDSITVLPGHDGELNTVRVLHTHVYSQNGGCPRCTGVVGHEPDLENLMESKMRRIDDIAVIRHMQEIRSDQDRWKKENRLERQPREQPVQSPQERMKLASDFLRSTDDDITQVLRFLGFKNWNSLEWDGLPAGRKIDTLTPNPNHVVGRDSENKQFFWKRSPITTESKLYLKAKVAEMIRPADVQRHMSMHDLYHSMLPESETPIHFEEMSSEDKLWTKLYVEKVLVFLLQFCWDSRAESFFLVMLHEPKCRLGLDAAIEEGKFRLPLDGEFEYILSLLPPYIVECIQTCLSQNGRNQDISENESIRCGETTGISSAIGAWVDEQPLPQDVKLGLTREFALLRRSIEDYGYTFMAFYFLQRDRRWHNDGRMNRGAGYQRRIPWQGEDDYVLSLATPLELKEVYIAISKMQSTENRRASFTSVKALNDQHPYADFVHCQLPTDSYAGGWAAYDWYIAPAVVLKLQRKTRLLQSALQFQGIFQQTRTTSAAPALASEFTGRLDSDSASLISSFLGTKLHPPAFGPVERHDNNNPKRAFEEEKKDEDGDEEMKSEEEERRVKSRTQGRASKLY